MLIWRVIVLIFAGFIRRWLEKVRPGKAVKKADLLNEGLMALAGITPQDKRPRDLLPLNLPQLQDGHVPAFLGLGFPDTAEMVDYLDNCGRSEQNIHWKYQGSQHYENIGDLVKMSAALCEHPDEFLKVFVWNMTVAYFPDKLFAAVGTYFRLPHPEVGLKPTEATFA